jgi:hypothetical protein
MYYYKIKVTPVSTPVNNFSLTVDGYVVVNLTPGEVSTGVIVTFTSYRPPRFFGFPQSTHTLNDGFLSDTPKYSIMASYPARKYLSYTAHSDSGEYNIEVQDVQLYNVVDVTPAS